MDALRNHYAAIKQKNHLAPLEATIQYFATVLYDDCLIDDFYEEIDIEFEAREFENSLLGSLIKN